MTRTKNGIENKDRKPNMNQTQTKQWYTSKTIWGLIISLAGKAVAGIWGLEVTEEDVVRVTDGVVTAISLTVSVAGDIFAWYGRVKAEKEISEKVI